MSNQLLDLDVFSLRDGEVLQLCIERPKCKGDWLAVMARTVSMPPGPHRATRDMDGEPVEMAAIIAARVGKTHGEWVWQQLSPPTKEFVGDFMFEQGAEMDRWYYLLLSKVDFDPAPPEVHINGGQDIDTEAGTIIGKVVRQVVDGIK